MLHFRCRKGWVGFFSPLLPCEKGVHDRLLILFSYSSRGAPHVCPSAKRFKKQVFLSVDVPPEVYSSGRGLSVLLDIEKSVVEQLKGL